ncbi:uncharacterized protein LOC143445936 [Clavelina lepadiformis]|uniref:uncharacterized protein LOC143445936 n=1 Tax=Clavelina lepadiformis TaxID=159417 RepID=UPI0040421E35
MSSNVPWNNQFEGLYSGTALSQSEGSWNRPAVNTPQTNPASWPQLGSAPAEPEQPPQSMSQTPMQNLSSQDDTSTWNAGPQNSATTNSETDSNGTNVWGRMPDNNNKNGASATGWGVPSNSWGQHQSTVDDGTAVWGKSSASQQPQGNWGGQVMQGNESSSSGWGVSEPTPPPPPTNSHGQEVSPPLSNSQQTPLPNSSQSNSSNQPVSWAKAASAGLPTNNNGNEASTTEKEPEIPEPPSTPVPPPTTEPDPVQKLVNSHEGWGKKPIQQGTSWNVSDVGIGRSSNQVSNGTEAWGKPTGGQMPPAGGWTDAAPAQKPAAGGWGGNYNQPTAQSQSWGTPSQKQPPRPFMSNNPSSTPAWGDPPSQQSSVNNGRWGDMPSQAPVAQAGGWGAPPVPQHPPGGAGWGGMQPTGDSNPNPGWGTAPPSRAGQSGSSWSSNMVPQSPMNDQAPWGTANQARRHSTVDDGTAAWGDPGTYSKVNMWDKRGKGGNEGVAGQMPNPNPSAEAKGWGVPTQPNQPTNRPPSPKSWGELSQSSRPVADNGTSGWGSKSVQGEKWDKSGNGLSGNWNQPKPSAAGWGQSNDQQWSQSDSGSGWGQPIGKNDNMLKSNMDFGPRGMIQPQPNINQQSMPRNQMPNVLPPQLQNQFNQIRHAVMNGVIPPHVLNPQLMTPQHMHTLLQLVNKAAEYQRLQMQMNLTMQNKNIAPIVRQQQIEQYNRVIRQVQQQIEAQRAAIMQNVLQKAPNIGKSNGPVGGMDLGMRSGGQSMMSPLNNMGSLAQGLPSSMPTPTPNLSSPTMREPQSRLLNSWKQPNQFGGIGDNLQPPNPSVFNNVGPGGDAMYNGVGFRHPQEDGPGVNLGPMKAAAIVQSASQSAPGSAAADPNLALADIGPPEFTPGVPWKGLQHIDPETDPDITPGSVAMAKAMSLNTVKDADQVLKRERNAHSESSTGAQTTSADDTTINAISTDTNTPTDSGPPSAWSSSSNNTAIPSTVSNMPSSLPQDLWRTPPSSTANQRSAFRSGKEQIPQGWDQPPANSPWDQSQSSRSQQGASWSSPNPDNRGSWIVLTNFNNQVDVGSVRQLCMQQGAMISFQPHYPMEGMALVRYSSPDDAANAKKALNMCMAGSTMLVATVATDQEVNNFVTATAGGSWGSSSSGGSNRFMSSGAGSTGGFMSHPSQRPNMGGMPNMNRMTSSGATGQQWSNASSSNVPVGTSWANNGSPNVAWSGATGEDMSRIMSPIYNLLPENLLGGETM